MSHIFNFAIISSIIFYISAISLSISLTLVANFTSAAGAAPFP